MIAYIIHDLNLPASLRTKTSLAYQDGTINLSYLMEKCPRLDALCLGTLRVVKGALSARRIVGPTHMDS